MEKHITSNFLFKNCDLKAHCYNGNNNVRRTRKGIIMHQLFSQKNPIHVQRKGKPGIVKYWYKASHQLRTNKITRRDSKTITQRQNTKRVKQHHTYRFILGRPHQLKEIYGTGLNHRYTAHMAREIRTLSGFNVRYQERQRQPWRVRLRTRQRGCVLLLVHH
jgi:hypothetical protein